MSPVRRQPESQHHIRYSDAEIIEYVKTHLTILNGEDPYAKAMEDYLSTPEGMRRLLPILKTNLDLRAHLASLGGDTTPNTPEEEITLQAITLWKQGLREEVMALLWQQERDEKNSTIPALRFTPKK